MKDWTKRFSSDLWLDPAEDGQADAAFILSVLGLRPGDRVLDAPCGDGRIGLHLARAGCLVAGIDFQPSFVARAEHRFEEEHLDGRFFLMDIRRMDFIEEFDAACCWGGSFGYFSDEENAALLGRFARALRPSGRLIVDQPNREYLLRHFRSTIASGERLQKNRWNRLTKRVESDWVVNRAGVPEHNRLSIRLYAPREMERIFGRAGLELESNLRGLDGSHYSRSGRRMIMIGRKVVARSEPTSA